jgi:hypothetical protein
MRLRAPATDGATLVVPPWRDWNAALDRNRERLARLASRREQARHEIWQRVVAYHRSLGEPVASETPPPRWILSGHQPELFHPGVWLKNFVLAGYAHAQASVGLNLVVDNDTIKSPSVRLPEGEPVAFGRYQGEQPWEERLVDDEALFASFPDRVRSALARWNIEPLAATYWTHLPPKGPMGERFAVARRGLERAWGCHNAELPLSWLCETRAFTSFAGELVADAPRFATIYNEEVRAYRAAHKIKSRNHPVPDLVQEGEWTELPLWTWNPGARKRERVMVNGQGTFRFRGERVRSRALLTTLFARLFLADWFVHGIGGGIYDQLTDAILRRYWGIEPPEYAILTGTRWLPLPRSGVSRDDWRQRWRHLRDLTYQPERFVGPEMASLVAERQAILREPPSRQQFARQRALLETIAAPLASEREAVRQELALLERTLHHEARLRRRDYSLVLFPESSLRPWLTAWLSGKGDG